MQPLHERENKIYVSRRHFPSAAGYHVLHHLFGLETVLLVSLYIKQSTVITYLHVGALSYGRT